MNIEITEKNINGFHYCLSSHLITIFLFSTSSPFIGLWTNLCISSLGYLLCGDVLVNFLLVSHKICPFSWLYSIWLASFRSLLWNLQGIKDEIESLNNACLYWLTLIHCSFCSILIAKNLRELIIQNLNGVRRGNPILLPLSAVIKIDIFILNLSQSISFTSHHSAIF